MLLYLSDIDFILSNKEIIIMGLFETISDKAIGGLTKTETVRISYEELAKIIKREFIDGQDDVFLSKVLKTAKGGFLFDKNLKSKNQRYDFHVGTRPHGLVWLNSKPAWVFDNEENKFYQLDKNIKFKKLYKTIKTLVYNEKYNRNR